MSIGSGDDLGTRKKAQETRTGRWWILALAGLTGTFVALACYGLISSAGELGAGSPAGTVRAASPTHGLAGTAARSSTAAASPAPSSPASRTGSAAPGPLTVTSVTAFGPNGTSDGDNPGIVSRLLDAGSGQPWYSQWYATSDFGHLRPGTGLLLTLGATAAVRDVRMVLGAAAGVDVQVRVGNSAAVNLPVVASASGVGGTVSLSVHVKAVGQYVLVWFTRLPPDEHGHYQVSVYSVTVQG